jgi:hypothetical protein
MGIECRKGNRALSIPMVCSEVIRGLAMRVLNMSCPVLKVWFAGALYADTRVGLLLKA